MSNDKTLASLQRQLMKERDLRLHAEDHVKKMQSKLATQRNEIARLHQRLERVAMKGGLK